PGSSPGVDDESGVTTYSRVVNPSWSGRVVPRYVVLALAVVSCSRTPPAPPPPTVHITWGETMPSVARRFELLGRAGMAGRMDLARYELGEIQELFENTLPHAEPPREGHPE